MKEMTLEKIFDTIARVITSMGAVLTVMLTTITSMVFFSHTLFGGVFPVLMDTWEKSFATWLMAISWEATVLITTVNVRHVNKHIPGIMAICSGVIVLFFIQAFDGTQEPLTLVQRWFVGVLAATINYIYADLFYAKWVERTNLIEAPFKQEELQAKLNESERAVQELRAEVEQSRAALNQVRGQLQQTEPELKELRALRLQFTKERTCPHCKVEFTSPDALRSHKGRCTSKQMAA